MRLSKRAEAVERSRLIETFVDTGSLFTLLSSHDHQIVYGRRGTGKTHALIFLASTVQDARDIAVYVDLRRIGSTGGIYGDELIPIPERATRLLMDVLAAIHDNLLEHILEDDSLNLGVLGPALDEFADAITEVNVSGTVETSETSTLLERTSSSASAQIRASLGQVGIEMGAARSSSAEEGSGQQVRRSGTETHRVHFGRVGNSMERISASLGGKRLWILLDEWSVIPPALQPYLADLLRRSLLPVPNVTIKIGAIEYRSHFQIHGERGTYLGMELGADIAADLNLDDFMVFENDSLRATHFFEQLIYKHFLAAASEMRLDPGIGTSAQLVQVAFTQRPTFEELVRAAEGVPRDAINIISLAAQRAGEAQISHEHIRSAARTWYQRDKEAAVSANVQAKSLLNWIIDEVIGHRKARAFLLLSNIRHDLIDALFDSRVLHVLKKNISSRDEPGVRYDVYKIDYGCYVDLLATARAPQGLLPAEQTESTQAYIDVPPDDYRAIRRAILNLDRFRPE